MSEAWPTRQHELASKDVSPSSRRGTEAGKNDTQEEAARTLGASAWQTFWRITLPSIRAGVIYGVVLTMARALGEFGAVSVVSGNIQGVTQTLTMYVDYQYDNFNNTGAYVASIELAVLAVATLLLLSLIRGRNAGK